MPVIVTTDEFQSGRLNRAKFAATIRADINDVKEIESDWIAIIGWLRDWTKKRAGNTTELQIIILAERILHDKIKLVIQADLPPNDSEFSRLIRELSVMLSIFDHLGDSSLDWHYPN